MPADNQQVTSYIGGLDSPQKEICERLRMMIATAFPALDERWAWSRPVYATGKGYVCHVVANKSDVNLGFEHGAQLDDPRGRLTGTGINMRHIKIGKLDDLDLDYCQGLLAQAVGLAHDR